MKLNSILIIVVVILIALGGFKLGEHIQNKKTEETRLELRKQIIKADSLTKLKEGLYRKLVADTMTIAQLRRQADSLKLELKNPKIVIKTVYKFKEIEKPIDGIVVKDSTLEVNDAYPNKTNPFVKYFAKINLKTNAGVGKFTFEPLNINLGIEQNADGTYGLNSSVPDFINISSIDVTALPLDPVRTDNFGILLGAGLGQDFNDNSNFFVISSGIRYKKVILDIQGTSNKTLSSTLKFEF